jgi:transcriptional regulator with XRE-family HTH domain
MIKNLKKLRTEKKISQQHLAGVLGISQQSINKYENHNVEPDISILIAMAQYFNTTIDYLVGKDDISELSEGVLSDHEKGLISHYRELNDSEKLCVDTLVDTYRKERK